MRTLKENLAALLKVKTVVTLCVMAVWMALAFSGAITGESVTNLTLMVLSFYFGTQTVRKSTKEK